MPIAKIVNIDKDRNVLTSMDLVRSYSGLDPDSNDVVAFNANKIDIYYNTSVPNLSGYDMWIVLGIDDGTVIGFKMYPFDTDLSVYNADTYKVLWIKGYKKCDDIDVSAFTDIIDVSNGISLSHSSGEVLLTTGPTKWIAINYDKKCFKVFK